MSLAVALYKPHQHGVSKLAPINPPQKNPKEASGGPVALDAPCYPLKRGFSL